MTPAERLTDLRERFGPNATRVGDPPTAAEVALLLRTLDQPKCVDDAKMDEIRERAKSHRAMDRMDRTMYASGVIDAMLADIDTLLDALDAERALAEKAERNSREAIAFVGAMVLSNAGDAGRLYVADADLMRMINYSVSFSEDLKERRCIVTVQPIERGEHREGRDDDANV